ncbi:hypothetical protein TPY_3536 [Sulfobacillus acidophilus TPY]|uniref:Uncharacterized protein n=1 Tax=Sulfobacillus acidophilus (strain ATCC 700253 / DSM 10332 / NAL) TaxID=679936 RepID=G8TWH8_SULAD|nr:hypothetical protein TPY_3536 [Sulfobacillus acidophilus TPY]AEW04876.1 hypothetical protein Sulac_1379 [Sulfobacillus acidophilus DSM 10332]
MREVDCNGFSWIPHVVRIAQAVRQSRVGDEIRIWSDRDDMLAEVRAFAHTTGNHVSGIEWRRTTTFMMEPDARGSYNARPHPVPSLEMVITLRILPTNRLH